LTVLNTVSFISNGTVNPKQPTKPQGIMVANYFPKNIFYLKWESTTQTIHQTSRDEGRKLFPGEYLLFVMGKYHPNNPPNLKG
jgi:hypothetical protein